MALAQAQVANFAILRRHINGTVTEYQPNTSEFSYTSSAVNLALQLMSTPQVKRAMALLAIDVENQRTGNWPQWYPPFNNNLIAAERFVDSFLLLVKQRFPMVVIDERLTDPSMYGYHPRGEWNQQFDPRDQAVHINAQKMQNMVAASGQGLNFRTFQFQLANTLLHEVGGHLLVTYIGTGRPMTPPTVGHPGYNPIQHGQVVLAGEAGRNLESKIWNGTLEFYRDPQQGNSQPGMPYIRNEFGLARRITETTINEFVSYYFSVPYAMDPNAVPSNTLQSLGFSAGNNAAQAGPHMMAHQSRQGYLVRLSDVRAIPLDPRIRVRAA